MIVTGRMRGEEMSEVGVVHVPGMWWPCHGRSIDFNSTMHRIALSVTTAFDVSTVQEIYR